MSQVPMRSAGIDALTAGNAASAKVVTPFETNLGCKLAANTTFYFSLGDGDAVLKHLTVKWDASVIVNFQLETTSIPAKKDVNFGDSDSLKEWDNTAGNGWNLEPITSASVNLTDTTNAVGGASVASNQVQVAGGTVGSFGMHFGNFGAKRARLKAAVQGTGGVVWVAMHGKY